jgi:hypothetical protein
VGPLRRFEERRAGRVDILIVFTQPSARIATVSKTGYVQRSLRG